jgi:hypothetical protein
MRAPMPRVVVDVNEEAYLWLQSQQGQWKPATAVLREIIEDAMKRQQRSTSCIQIKSSAAPPRTPSNQLNAQTPGLTQYATS